MCAVVGDQDSDISTVRPSNSISESEKILVDKRACAVLASIPIVAIVIRRVQVDEVVLLSVVKYRFKVTTFENDVFCYCSKLLKFGARRQPAVSSSTEWDIELTALVFSVHPIEGVSV